MSFEHSAGNDMICKHLSERCRQLAPADSLQHLTYNAKYFLSGKFCLTSVIIAYDCLSLRPGTKGIQADDVGALFDRDSYIKSSRAEKNTHLHA